MKRRRVLAGKEKRRLPIVCFHVFMLQISETVVYITIGQVGNVITNRNASRQEFERLLVSYVS